MTKASYRIASATRHAAHVEEIRPGVAGLFLGDPDPDGMGPEGYALKDCEGRIQWLAQDCEAGTYRHLPVDPTTGAYVLPLDDEGVAEVAQ